MTTISESNAIFRFFSWWIDALSEVFVSTRSRKLRWQILVAYASGGIKIFERKGRSVTQIGALTKDSSDDQITSLRSVLRRKFSSHRKATLLRLSSANVLQKTIQIPKAALDVIDPVIRNQMERMLPWPPSDTRYGYEVLGQSDAMRDQVDVSVVATSQSQLDTALAEVDSLGLNPIAVDFAPSEKHTQGIVLHSFEPDSKESVATRLRWAIAVGFAISICVSAVGFILMAQKSAQSGELIAQISKLDTRLASIRKFNAQSIKLRQERDRLTSRKKEEPAVLFVVEALSRILPDDAFLVQLDVHNRDIRIVGKSPDPTGLIRRLEDTDEFANVRFSAPTTRDRTNAVEAFSITAQASAGNLLVK